MLNLPRFSLRLRLSLSIIGIVVLFTLTNITYQISGENRNLRLDNLQNAVQGQLTSVAIRQLLENQQNEILVLDALKQSSEENLTDSEIDNGIDKLNIVQGKMDELGSYVYQEGLSTYEEMMLSHDALNTLWAKFYRGYNKQQTPHIASIEKRFIQTIELLSAFETLEIQAAEQQTNELQTSSRVTDRITLAIYLFTIVLTVSLGFMLIRYTTRSLNELSLGTVRIGKGDLNHHIPITFNDELGDLAFAFNDMAGKLRNAMAQVQQSKDRADQANKAKTNFLANMSHELRTPLNAIIGYSEMIIEAYREENQLDEEQSVNDLQHILSSGRHLLQLINDVLDLAKIESGNMNVFNESFNSVKIINDLTTIMQPLAKKGNNTLIIETSTEIPQIYSDAVKFRQIFINLLSNACKFTHDGKITILITHNSYKQQLIYHVSDTGIGMSAEQLNHIFEAFVQADSSTSKEYGGTGLGLAICRQFIQLMHGSLDVSSAPDEGTTFTIVLPISVQAPRKHEVIPTKNQQELGLIPAKNNTDVSTQPEGTNGNALVLQEQSSVPSTISLLIAKYHASYANKAYFSTDGDLLTTADSPLLNTVKYIDIAIILLTNNIRTFKHDWLNFNRLLNIENQHGTVLPIILAMQFSQQTTDSLLSAQYESLNHNNRQRLTTQLRQHNPIDRRGDALLVSFEEPSATQLQQEIEAEAWHYADLDLSETQDLNRYFGELPDVIFINCAANVEVVFAVLDALQKQCILNENSSIPNVYIINTASIENIRLLDRVANEIIFL